MSNRNYATDYVVHALNGCANPRKRDRMTSINPVHTPVTCKRCLAVLAKKDRAAK